MWYKKLRTHYPRSESTEGPSSVHTNSFYSPKQSNMSPTATPNSTTLQGAWPATSMYRPSRFRFPMAHPAAYGSYTASSSGSRTPEWPGQVGNS
ncbi:hypothetical protein CHS0354_031465 [Potamilus streckersoni]|uniref:Uncharacterized protein n=1 Tax=Potamilus streckersoni TaxID=2493646 RepID=A0AAE0VV95_9BIVA|nr:hypothetical protein CHS0354_031465 [Potamilus streckersoni]